MTHTIESIAAGLDGLAAVIRKHGTCAPAALEECAERLRKLAPEASGTDDFVMVESAVRSLPSGYAFADAAEHANPAPPTSDELTASEALYGFAGWLTGLSDPVTFSARHWAAPAAEMVGEYCAAASLAPPRDDFPSRLPQMPANRKTPADESGAEEGLARIAAKLAAEQEPHGMPITDEAFAAMLDGPEPRAAAQEEVAAFERWARCQFSGAEVFDRIEGRPANALGLTWEYNGNAVQSAWASWIAGVIARLQPPGAAEDAARWPEVFAERLADGWTFAYEPSTHYVGMNHPHGGKQSVVRVEYGAYDEQIGNAIAAAMNAARRARGES